MEDLLHERLKRHSATDGYFVAQSGKGILLTNYEAQELADEIERYYIPRPRFEDGEPVQFGDEYQADNGTTNELNQLHCFEQGYVLNRKGKRASIKAGEFVKRPTPKVYDADGVEIKAGDTVWSSMYGDNSFTVERISKNPKGEPLVMVEEMGSGLFPVTCYHERPVFDAEGVRICNGDTDYWTKDGRHVEVLQVGTYQGGKGCLVRSDQGTKFVIEGKDLTHREPDSLKDIIESMQQFADTFHDREGWIKGFKGIMERLTRYEEMGA